MRLLGLLVLVGCAHNVPQDRQTGPDGRVKGAELLVFENGEARVKGIVTYPGGDRIDWRVIELPEKTRGKLDMQLTWRTPRPGLQVAFDVFDQYNTPVIAANASKKGGRLRTASLDKAVGKYFVRIYAPKRGDAGAYTFVANFVPDVDDSIDLTKVPVSDPPKLAAVPPPTPSCPMFDRNNDACQTACPSDAPDDWVGCDARRKQKLDDDAKAAAKAARAACLANQPTEFDARIIHVEVNGDQVNVKLDTGIERHPDLTTGWTARVLISGTEKAMANGTVKLLNVGKLQTRASSGLTVDQLTSNPWVRLFPPPANCP